MVLRYSWNALEEVYPMLGHMLADLVIYWPIIPRYLP